MVEWKKYTVAELVEKEIIEQPLDGNHGGVHPKVSDFVRSGIPFIVASDINNGQINIKTCKYISKKQADSLAKGFSRTGDVLLTHKATIGRTALVPLLEYPYIMLTPQVTYYRVRNSEVLSNIYLKYYFDSRPFQKVLCSWAGAGSTRAYLGIIGQLNLPIMIPPIKIQQNIAAVLSVLDSKIELNNRVNVELETMAKTLFDYWFVQFDFPDKNRKPYKSSGGKMSWSEELKRDIPERWEVGSLLDIAEYINGLACQNYKTKGNKSLPVIKIKEMHEGFSSDTEVVSTDIPQKVIIENGDVLFSWSASLEVMIWAGGKGALNQHIFKVTSDKYPKSFFYYQLINYLQHFKMMAANRKTTMGHITQEHLEQSRIALPPKQLTRDLEVILLPIFNKKLANDIENKALSELRDWLLPMLMNGQITVN